jgi:hypothetical protein
MGKFTLLTTLTLNAAGYNKGIDSAKKSTKALSDGVKEAGTTISKSFEGLSDSLGGVGGQLSGLSNVATGGISAFKKMIPAITGIKTALISSGIGIIVVGLGVAFAALASYLNGTSEGASKLNKIMAFAKGTFNAILQRVQLLGEAISLVFEGKFKQAGEKLKAAFAGGLLDEIKANATQSVALAERENKLWAEKVAWKVKESELQIKLDENKLKLENKEISALERQKVFTEAVRLQTQISVGRIGIAAEELDIQKEKNKLVTKSREDIEAEADLQVALNLEMAKKSSSQKELAAKGQEINNTLKSELATQKQLNELDKIQVKMPDLLALNNIKPPDLDTTKLKEYKGEISSLKDNYLELSVVIQNNLVNAINSLSQTFISGGNSFKEYAKNVKSAIKQTIGAFIAEGVAAMVGNALKTSAKLGPIGLALAPALAALAGGLAKTAFNSLIPKFHTGGIVGGVGEVSALLQPKEMVLTQGQQANLFNMINGGVGGGELTTRISGGDLLVVLNNYGRKVNSFR